MQPIRFSINKDGVTQFHYTIKELRWFIKYAYEGCTGPILWQRKGNTFIYKHTGTLENPHPVSKMGELFTISVVHNELFDGEIRTDEEIVKPSPIPGKDFPLESYRIVFIDDTDYGVQKSANV